LIGSITNSSDNNNSTPTRVTRRNSKKLNDVLSSVPAPVPVIAMLISEKDMEINARTILENYRGARFAKSRPKLYLRLVSYVMVLTELATLLTPMVAIGAQWMTALCKDTPTVKAIISLTYWSLWCMLGRESDMCDRMADSCIIASN
jgi:hypothetical protein